MAIPEKVLADDRAVPYDERPEDASASLCEVLLEGHACAYAMTLQLGTAHCDPKGAFEAQLFELHPAGVGTRIFFIVPDGGRTHG